MLFNFNIIGGYKLKWMTISLRAMGTSSLGEDEFEWWDDLGNKTVLREKWEFRIGDVSLGVGYTVDDLMFKGTRHIWGVRVGSYAVELKSTVQGYIDWRAGGGEYQPVDETKKYTGNTVSYGVEWLWNTYLTKNISLNGVISYKIARLDRLGEYKDIEGKEVEFDFSGLKGGLGINIWF